MSIPTQLQRLADGIGAAVALSADDMARGIRAALHEATAGERWLPSERRRANHERYARHLLYGDPAGRFSILSLVWDHGQESPVHGHHTWCAVGVYDGILTETLYREQNDGQAPLQIGAEQRATGSLSFDPPHSAIHRIGNASGAVAVSLHVYGVAADRISTGVNRVYT